MYADHLKIRRIILVFFVILPLICLSYDWVEASSPIDSPSSIYSSVNTVTAIAFNSANLLEDSALFLAQFSVPGWSGNLLRYSINENGTMGSLQWDAAKMMSAQDDKLRFIFTYNEDANRAVPFRQLSDLSMAQQADLNTAPDGSQDGLGQKRIAFLRGEGGDQGSIFRTRTHRLADSVHSAPIYVGHPESNWPDTPPFPTVNGSRYSDFKRSKAFNRTPVVYVGDNSGLLQGVNANTGKRIFGYIPSDLFSSRAKEGLHYLTDPNYLHRYYVDLTARVQDVYIPASASSSAAWRTILIGGQGRGYFALDVTDPEQFSDANTDELFLWEFSSDDDQDLGYAFSEPVIGLMNNGRWAAIIGNGDHSTGSGSAKLIILYLDGGLDGVWSLGKDYVVIDTKQGDLTDVNGLSSPLAIDLNGNQTIDRIYAGDLLGNLWAFDVSSDSASNWGAAYDTPLFSSLGKTQPITARPFAVAQPVQHTTTENKPNVLVLVGSGQYFTSLDKSNSSTQAFFGVWDHGIGGLTQDNLIQQNIVMKTETLRVISDKPVFYGDDVHGWYLNFNHGERVTVTPIVRDGTVFFNTLIPDRLSNSLFSGSGWVMAVDALNGGEPSERVIDINYNGMLDKHDQLNDAVVSGIKIPNAIPMQGTLRGNFMFVPSSDSRIHRYRILNSEKLVGRISWHELEAE